MTNNKELPNREELQEEFRAVSILRNIKRALEKSGIDIPIEAIRATVDEYEKLHSELLPESDSQEILVDGDMVRSHLDNGSE